MTIRPQQPGPEVTSIPQPQRRWRPGSIALLIVSLIVLLTIGSLGWWLLSPLFFHTTSNVTNPFAHSPAAVSKPSTASTGQPGTPSTPVPGHAVILATGKFIDITNSGQGLNNDHGSGNVTIGKTADGKYLLYFDHLNVTNGPDLHVYLAPTVNSTDAGQVKSEGVDLGLLTATQGSLNVTVPADIGSNLTKYHSVVIVCKTFSVIFTTAPLAFSAGS
ncbi:MAG: DM13 domain-containing protein [Ktedonobacteraceae bacterium]